ncbi:hypothetical protein M501DRAFT_935163 [Patellaria atrata CBS 101060]|uniref:Rhodopsin domain-containing protein n=1 Tax=Patellaria atrata CBS 101060 TaxID=1346257 RepID=A0A9P4VSS0_9PEZI|nr:hypothetical protein M501DRAFT_935163 [Patellaria atrata CBS 101060]
MSAEGPPVYESVYDIPGDRFATITSDDHGGIVWITSLLFMTYTLLTFATRCFIKWHMFGVDDWAMVAAQVAAMGQYGAMFVAISNGLGKSTAIVDEIHATQIGQAVFASQILLILSLGLAKSSVILLIRRVFTRDMKTFWFICNIIVGVSMAWAVGSIIAVSVGCTNETIVPTADHGICGALVTRWRVVAILDVLLEAIFVLLPIYLTWNIQMNAQLKARVVGAFAFRIPVAIFAIIYVVSLERALRRPNTGVAYANPMVYLQVELGYSLIAATIPCLKSFIKSFDTGMGLEIGYSSRAYGSGANSNNSQTYGTSGFHSSRSAKSPGTYQLNSLNGDTVSKVTTKNDATPRRAPSHGPGDSTLRPEDFKNHAVIYHSNDKGDTTSSRSGSQEMIIRRDVQWDVRHDYAPRAR